MINGLSARIHLFGCSPSCTADPVIKYLNVVHNNTLSLVYSLIKIAPESVVRLIFVVK